MLVAVAVLTAGGCRAQATLVVVLSSEALAAATSSLAVSLARRGNETAAVEVCEEPAPVEEDFDASLTSPYPVADASFAELEQGWYAVWVRALDATDRVLAGACEVFRIGFFRRSAEVVLTAGALPDAGTDTDAGPDSGPPLVPICVAVVTEGLGAAPVPTTLILIRDATGEVWSGITDSSGETCLAAGAAVPVDVTVRRTVSGGLDYQLTVVGLTPLGDAFTVAIPTPFVPTMPNPAMVSGSITALPLAATGDVTFLDDVTAVLGTGPINGAGDGYDVMMSDASGTFSGVLRFDDAGAESVVVDGLSMLMMPPDFDASAAVPLDQLVDVGVVGSDAAYDGAREVVTSLLLARGGLALDAVAGPVPMMPVTVTVPSPTTDAGLAVALNAASSATVAACGGWPEVGAHGRRAFAAAGGSGVPATVDLMLHDPPTDVMPSAAVGTYPAFGPDAPIEWSNAETPGAMVLSLAFTRPSGAAARIEVVVPGDRTTAAVPNPAGDADLLQVDAGGYCLTLAAVDVTTAASADIAGRAAAIAAGAAGLESESSTAYRLLSFAP